MKGVVAAGIVILAVLGMPLRATAQTMLAGDKLVLIKGQADAPDKVVFIAHASSVFFPEPSMMRYGLRLQVLVPAPTPEDPGWWENGFEEAAVLPRWHWRYRGRPRERFVYLDPAPAPGFHTTRVVVKRIPGGLSLRWEADDAGLDMRKRLGSVGVRVFGFALGSCALFSPEAVVEDRPGRFIAKGATAPSACYF